MSNIVHLSVIISFLICLSSQEKLFYNKRKLNYENTISIHVNGTGKIFICRFMPDEVYLEGEKINFISDTDYYVRINNTNNNNTVTIKFNRILTKFIRNVF